ncbi:MAG: helix-turn-helix domain-containing protein [Patescibacteria group bacterium]
MYQKLFLSAGLTEEQAKIYDALLKNKGLPASRISRLCEMERSFVYKILNQLTSLKLAQKIENKGEIAIFRAEHPQRILDMVEEKRVIIENSFNQIRAEIGNAISSYNITIGKPSVRFGEGLSGLEELHQDIIRSGEDIKLFRSHLDRTFPENKALIKKQRGLRVSAGLKTKIVGALPGALSENREEADIEIQRKEDASFLVDRRIVDDFDVPAQITIYGNKVAIIDFKNNIITTIIENESVRETFEKIFDYMFNTARKL